MANDNNEGLEQIKEILLKQMKLLQERSENEIGSELANLSCSMVEVTDAYIRVINELY